MTFTRPSSWCSAALLLSALLTLSLPAAADWPMPRHDVRRTALALGRSNIAQPEAFWRFYTGGVMRPRGALLRDLDQDGTQEVLMINGGKIVAKEPSTGDMRWQTKQLEIGLLLGFADLDGDGSEELVARSSSRVHILRPSDGTVLWSEPLGEMGTIGSVRLGDLDGDGAQDLLIQECGCCGKNSGNTGFAYRFSGPGALMQSPALMWTLPSIACGAAGSSTLVRTRSANQFEFVHGANNTLSLLAGSDGQLLATSANLGSKLQVSRCLGVDVDGGQEEILCVLSDGVTAPGNGRRAMLLRRNGAALSLVWEQLIGDVDGRLRIPPSPIGDLDGDGQLEIVLGGVDSSDGVVTVVLDARTGALRAELAGQLVEGIAPISRSGPLLLSSRDATLTAWRLRGSALSQEWSLPSRAPLREPDWTLTRRSNINERLVTFDVDGDGVLEIITRSAPNASDIAAYRGDAPIAAPLQQYDAPPGAALSQIWRFEPEGGAHLLGLAQSDGNFHLLDASWQPASGNKEFGARFGGHHSPASFRRLMNTPVSGTLDEGPPALLVRLSRGAAARLDGRLATFAVGPSVLWQRAQTSRLAIVRGRASAATVIATDTSEATEAVIALRPDGSLLWRAPLAAPMLSDPVFGEANGDGVPDVFVQYGHDRDGTEQMRAISGADGSPLWNAPPIGPYNRQPSGAAITDYDGDGRDDVVYQANRTIVRSGRDGSELASSIGGFAYFMPLVDDVDDDGQVEFTLHGGFAQASTLDHDLQSSLWQGVEDDRPVDYATLVRCPGRAPLLVGGSWQFPARLKLTEVAGPAAGSFETRVLAGGQIFADRAAADAAGMDAGNLASPVAYEDLAGDGRVQVLVGSSDGYLYGIDPCSFEVTFSVFFDAQVGSIIFGDLDADGADDIIVSVADGYLYGLKQASVSSVRKVLDTDPPHGITAEDVDEIETEDRLFASWTGIRHADAYEAAVVRDEIDGGGFISEGPWMRIEEGTEATFEGLPLEDGKRYFVAVRALQDGQTSPDRLSDGVRVKLGRNADPGDKTSDIPEPLLLTGRSCVYFCSLPAGRTSTTWWALAWPALMLLARRKSAIRRRAERNWPAA